MALTGAVAPFGIRDIKLTTLPSGAQVDLPNSQKLSFTERLTSKDLKGDDAVVATSSFSEGLEWELEAGGIAIEAYALMTGRTVTQAGTTPNQTATMHATAGDVFPYFKIYGKVITDAGDLHVKIYKAKITELSGEFKGDEYFVTTCKGKAITDGTNIFTFVRNETAANLPSS